ncbi:MAG: rfbC [Rickettsiaceae bacterium]|jgi:dTDP-4-dehydrorhamnose 3,5-epimerase|nr:rfbC [Rickettsiaceae bacterium]
MKITNTPIAGLKLIELTIHEDQRGFFVERFNKKSFADLGLPTEYFQDNFSYSIPGVIRGLHYQTNPSQAKLVGCIRGRIWDVAVDIRKDSPAFGQHFGVELSGENGKLLYIPAGFAHGFCVLGDEPADVAYKVDNPYSKAGDGGIAFDDPDLKIDWPVKNPIVSDKDKALQSFKEYKLAPCF